MIKNTIRKTIDKIGALECTISIGDIMLNRGCYEPNQLLTISRLLDIEQYYKNNDNSFSFQNSISFASYGNDHDVNGGNRAFVDLLESYTNNGFIGDSSLVVDNEICLLDGNHRLGLCLWGGYIPLMLVC